MGEQHRRAVDDDRSLESHDVGRLPRADPIGIARQVVNSIRIGITKVLPCFNGVNKRPARKGRRRGRDPHAGSTDHRGVEGFGLALARRLVRTGGASSSTAATRRHSMTPQRTCAPRRTVQPSSAIAGDVADPGHRATLVAAATELGRLDLVVNNASMLGPSPQPTLSRLSARRVRATCCASTSSLRWR